MTTAFVLSGGGSLGAVQVGMLLALAERGILPDLVVGTSVGAVNAAWIAGRPDPGGAEELADVWRSVRRDQVFPTRPLTGLRGFLGRTNHLVPPNAFRALLARHVRFDRLEDSPIPIMVVATEITTGQEVVLSRGDAVDAIAASAAIPGVFPAVEMEGHLLVDGGVTDNTPIRHAVEAGASTVYVLPTGHACSLEGPPHGAIGTVLHAITILVQRQLVTDIERFRHQIDLRVLPVLCPLDVSPVDFSHSAELISRAHDAALRWLDVPGGSLPMPMLHRHAAGEAATWATRKTDGGEARGAGNPHAGGNGAMEAAPADGAGA